MQPNLLTLTRFKGIRSGLNRDSITLNLEQFKDAHLIAIAGPNGVGKSTLLENLHPYRLMPSYASEPRPTSFSYWDHVEEGEAAKVLEWTFADKRYKSEFVFKSMGGRKKADYYLLEADNVSGWKPFTREDVTSDGRSDTYDRAIELLLGPPEIFFNSIFCSQNRKQLTAHKESEGTELIARLLSLDQLIELGQKASKVVKALSLKKEQVEAKIRQIEDKSRNGEAIKAGLAAKKQAIESLSHKLAEIDERIIAARARETLAQQQGQEFSQLQAKSAELKARLEAVQQFQEPTLKALAQSGESGLKAQEQVLESLRNTLKQLEAGIHRTSLTREELRRMSDRMPELRAAEQDKHLLETLSNEEAQYELFIQQASSRLEQLQGDLMATSKLVSEREEKVSLVRRELLGLEASSSLIQSVPCAGTPLNQTCTLLESARAGHAKLPAVKEQLASATSAVVQLQKEIEQLKPVADSTRQLLSSARPTITAQIQSRLKSYTEVLQQANLIQNATARLPLLDAEIAQSQEQLKAVQADLEAKHRSFGEMSNQHHEAMKAQQRRLSEELQSQLDEVRATLNKLQPAHDKEVLRSLMETKNDTERLRNQLSEAYMSDLAVLPDLKALTAEHDFMCNGLAILRQELLSWQDLAKALSKSGIVNLCVEDAGPSISALANQLLHESFGSRFTIRIDTLAADSKGADKECFRVQTLDTATGEVKPGMHNSGGQRIWINDALSKAVAIYLSRSSDRPYRTIFTDEADGALDADHRRSWIRMKRAMLNTGGFCQEFFISHSTEVIEEADQVLDVAALQLA